MLRHCCDADGTETLTLEPLKPLEQCQRVRCLFGNHFFITQGDMMLVRTEIRCQSIESRQIFSTINQGKCSAQTGWQIFQICSTINQSKYSARMTKTRVPFMGKSGHMIHTG